MKPIPGSPGNEPPMPNQSDERVKTMSQNTWKTSSKGIYKPQTEQHTYRFNAELWSEFQAECDQNLRNVRLVIEALVRHWLDADPKAKAAIAKRHREWAATWQIGGDPSSSVAQPPSRMRISCDSQE